MKSVLVLTSQIERKILTFSIRHKTLRSRQPAQELKAPSRCTRHSAHRPQRKLCSAANDPQPQTDPQTGNVPQIGPQMIRNRKRSRFGLQMVSSENEEWHGICFSGCGFNF